jgi:hypothetical protein
MNKLFRGWVLGFCALGCGAPASDGSAPAADDSVNRVTSGEEASALILPLFCSKDSDCTSRNAYCKFLEGACEGRGTCEPRAGICPQIFRPVCGCDRRTYPNACVAARAGVSILHQGECAPNPCATVLCPPGQYCIVKRATASCEPMPVAP